MANILRYLGMRFFGALPTSRKRERKKTQVNTRDYWSGTTTTLEADDAFTAAGSPMEALLSDEKEKTVNEDVKAQVRTAKDNATVMMQQNAADDAAGYNRSMEADGVGAATTVSEASAFEEAEVDIPTEDALLGQIEQFRQQAARLQKLMKDKENRAKELENLVEQRTDRADELQQLVDERKDKADELERLVAQREEAAKGVTEEVVKRLDGIYNRMETRLDQAEENIRGDVLDGVRVDTAHSQQLSDTVTSQGRQLESLQQGVDGVAGDAKEIYKAVEGVAVNAAKAADNTDEVLTRIDSLTGKAAEIADVRTAVDGISGDMAGLKENMDNVNAGVLDVNTTVAVINDVVDGMLEKAEGMSGGIEGISANVEVLPEKFYHMMTETIHSECVMNFRNTADLMKDMGDRLDQLEALKKETKGTRRFAVCAMIFAILTFLAAAGGAAVTLISML